MMLNRLNAVAREKRRLLLRRARFSALAAFLMGAALVAALDIWKGLPRPVVWIGGLCALALSIALFFREKRCRFRARDAARAIEAANPGLGQSVRTAAEVLVNRAEPSPVADALISTTTERLAWADTVSAAKVRFLRPFAIAASVLLAFWIVALAVSSDWRTAAARLAGVGATFTRIAASADPSEIVSEQPARVQALIKGRAVPAAMLHLREDGGDWREIAMNPSGARRFDAVFASVPRSLEYFVTAGDGRSATRRVECRIPAKLQTVTTRLTFPEYTGLPASEAKGGAIEAVEDTLAEFAFEFDRPVVEAKIVFSDETFAPVTCDGTGALAAFKVGKKDLKWHVAGRDAAGLYFETQPFRLRGFADKLPEIKLAEPRDDVEVTPMHELVARLRAKDDFGLAKVGLVLKVGDKTEQLFEKEFEARDVKQAAEMATAFLEKYPLTINDNVQVQAYATDRKPRNGARSVSPLVAVDIREYKRRFIAADPGDKPCECVNKLEKIITHQRRVFSDTTQLAEMSTGQEVPSALVPPLTAREQTAVGMTEEIVALLAELPTLADIATNAQEQMEQAIGALKAVTLPPACESENGALSSLLKLRRELIRKIGKSKSGGRPSNKNSSDEPPPSLAELAKRIVRAADAEKAVVAQLPASRGEKNAPAPLQREQEVALGDAGETLAELDAHAAATDLLRTRGKLAEDLMRCAAEQMSGDLAAARATLGKAEAALRELAGHLELLADGGTEETMQKLQARAEEAAHCLGDCAACQKGGGGSTKISSQHISDLAEKAVTLDDTLRQWTESAEQQDPGKSARLGAMRDAQKTGALPQELRALAETLSKPGESADTAKLAEALAERHRGIAAQLSSEREEMRRARAGQLSALREKLKPFLPPAAPKTPGLPAMRNVRGAALPAAAMESWNGSEGEIVLGEMRALADEKLTSIAENLGTMREQKVLYSAAVQQADARLAAMLAALQRNTALAVRAIEVPGNHRRVVESYFRALSDDFGDEKWDAGKNE